jgi:hypothetical protein
MTPAALPPRPGEVWIERMSGRRVTVEAVSSAGIAYVDAGGRPARATLDAFVEGFAAALENHDFAAAKDIRAAWLVDRHAAILAGASVLELGAHTGAMTARVVAHAGATTVVENSERCVALLRERFAERVTVLPGDAHRVLFSLPPGGFDVVLCAGILYHSAHPFLLLEGIATLAPRWVLIDTLNDDVEHDAADLVTEVPVNAINYRYNAGPDCGVALNLGSGLIVTVMRRLGYEVAHPVDKSAAPAPAGSDSAYFERWRRSLSAWFCRSQPRRVDFGGPA